LIASPSGPEGTECKQIKTVQNTIPSKPLAAGPAVAPPCKPHNFRLDPVWDPIRKGTGLKKLLVAKKL
jgi:hypothetical protein